LPIIIPATFDTLATQKHHPRFWFLTETSYDKTLYTRVGITLISSPSIYRKSHVLLTRITIIFYTRLIVVVCRLDGRRRRLGVLTALRSHTSMAFHWFGVQWRPCVYICIYFYFYYYCYYIKWCVCTQHTFDGCFTSDRT